MRSFGHIDISSILLSGSLKRAHFATLIHTLQYNIQLPIIFLCFFLLDCRFWPLRFKSQIWILGRRFMVI